MDDGLLPAIVAGASAAAVGITGSALAYLLGRQQITSRLKEMEESGVQARETANRQYQLEAMRELRQAVGGPKSQIIESVQALTAYLHRILETRRWDQLLDIRDDRPSVWLLVRPLAWAEILQRRMVYADRTLEAALIEDELRFMACCLLFERSLTEMDMLIIDNGGATDPVARIRYGTLSALVQDLISSDSETVMNHVNFVRQPPPGAAEIEILLNCTGQTSAHSDYCRARIILVYATANLFLCHFRFPYAWFEAPMDTLRYLDRLDDAHLALDIRARFSDWLNRAEGSVTRSSEASTHTAIEEHRR